MPKRQPCTNCPWRVSTPEKGFPGGLIDADELASMIQETTWRAMQCHCTPDGADAKICVGFVRRYPDLAGVQIAERMGRYTPDEIDWVTPPADQIHSLASLLRTHGGKRCMLVAEPSYKPKSEKRS